jgi:hypothetical protein
MCVLIFSTTFVKNISHSKKNSEISSECEKSSYCCRLLKKLEFFWADFQEKLRYQVLSKSVHWEPSCSTRTDRQTDGRTGMSKLHIVLLFQRATRMRHIVTSFVTFQSTPYFSTLTHKRCDFRKNVTEHKTCVLMFSTTFVYTVPHFKKNLASYCHKCENFFM